MSKLIKEMTGKTYGKLKVIGSYYDSQKKCNLCLCECECGNKTKAKPTRIISGRIKSCGCINRSKKIDITGQRFNYLLVIKQTLTKTNKNNFKWLCECICGNRIETTSYDLRSGNTQSCGCYNIKRVKETQYKHGHTIDKRQSLTYSSWANMIERCHSKNPTDLSKRNYQDRNITVCKRWRESFICFLEDMGERPSVEYSIDRINNSGNYEPGNCRWATAKTQNNNSRSNRVLEFEGLKLNVQQWSELLGLNNRTIIDRLSRGWSVEKTLSTPPLKKH